MYEEYASWKQVWKFCEKQIIFLLSKTFCFIFKQKHVIFYSLKSFFLRFLRIQLLQHFFAEADTKKIKICFTKSLGLYRLQKQIIFWKCNIMLSGHKSQVALYPGLFSSCSIGMCPQNVVPEKRVFKKILIICLRKKKIGNKGFLSIPYF